jgi:hypothetical protein
VWTPWLLNLVAAVPGFVWEGRSVHPGCLRELTIGLADSQPVAVALDLNGCRGSNRYASSSYAVDGAVLRWHPQPGSREYFQYEYLGVLASGIHVLRVAEGGGSGSGIFQSLLFVRLGTASRLDDGQRRQGPILTLAGFQTLGDRAQATVELKGRDVVVKRRSFLGVAGWGPEEVLTRRPE